MTILIGTIHGDLCIKGYYQLDQALSLYKPKSISLEFPEGTDLAGRVHDVQKKIDEDIDQLSEIALRPWVRILAFESICSQFYEGRAAYDYAQREGIPLHCVDHPSLVCPDLSLFPSLEKVIRNIEAIDPNIQSVIQSLPVEEVLKRFMVFGSTFYENPELLKQWFAHLPVEVQKEFMISSSVDMDTREGYMAERILALEPELHIGGIAHMSEEFSAAFLPGVVPLYRRLGSLVTERYPLAFACERRK